MWAERLIRRGMSEAVLSIELGHQASDLLVQKIRANRLLS
jgi:hypothetical protein